MGTSVLLEHPPHTLTHTHLTKTKSLEMRAPNEALGFTGHEKFIIPDLYMKL